jgi:two-component system, cell cycle sensor histidine kinase and response regulator CckA
MEKQDEISLLRARVRELEITGANLKSRCELLQRRYLDIPVAYQSLDADGRLIEVNQAWLDNLGYSRNEIIGRSFADFLMPSQRDHFATHFSRLRTPGEVLGNEVELLKRDGTVILASFLGRIEQDNQGNFLRTHCVFADVTKQKLIEARGEAERELLHICQVAKNINDMMSQLVVFFADLTGCEAVGVRLRQDEDFPYYTTTGFPASFVMAENTLCIRDSLGVPVRDAQGNPVLECMCGNILCERFDPGLPFFTPKGSFWTNSTSTLLATTSETDRQARTRNRCNGEGYESVALIPLRHQETTFGLIQFNDRRKGQLPRERVEQLEHLVAYVALTLSKHLADEQLRKSEEKYRLVVENAREGIIILQDERMMYVNDSAVNLGGYTIEHMLTEPFINFIDPDDRRRVMDCHEKRLRGESVGSPEAFRIIRQDGMVRWLMAKGTIVEWNGKAASLMFLSDMTEQRDAEINRQENEQNLKAILNATQESIQLLDLEGNILLANDAAARRLGVSAGESIGCNVFSMFPSGIAEQRKRVCRQVALSGEPATVQDNRGGMDLETHLWPVVNQQGKVDRIALFARDITERKLAEKKVAESHALLYNLASLVPGVIYQYRLYPDGRSSFPYASPGMFNIYEVTPEEVKDDATPVFGRLHPEDRERVSEDIFRSARTLETFYCEFRVVLPQQGLRWRWSQAQPQKLDDGSILWYGIISDITERKEFEEALKSSEEDLKESQRIAHIGSWRLDVAANKVVWSDELYRMYGFDPAYPPPPYSEHEKLFTRESWETLSAALQNTVDTGTPYTLELETIQKDRPNGWMWVHGMAVVDHNGNTVGLRGVAQDITERKRTEEALRKSEERLNFALQMNHTGGWDLDLNTKVSLRTFEHDRIFGYEKPLPLWTYDMFINHVVPEDCPRVDQHFHESAATHSDLNFECRIRRTDGETRWIWVAGCHLPGMPGADKRMAGIIQDITDRKRAEEEKEKLHAQLTQAQKMESVGRLAGGVAHDYNNMLGIIVGYSEMALEKVNAGEPLYSDLTEILNAANRSADITRQLLAFSRQQAISPKQINLNSTIESMLKMLRRLIGEDIDLVWKPKANIRRITMDPSQLDQILVNLCVNARDAILDVGTITIETSLKTFDKSYCDSHPDYLPGDYVALIVSDNGQGMTKDVQNNLFEPFFTTKEVGKGTGLGLATVYGIVKQNNGFINVDSEAGQGSSFTLYFPCDEQSVAVSPGGSVPRPDAKGNETILLVEDEESILKMAKVMLTRLGYQVIPARKPDQAIEIARQHSREIHLLMTDVVMPEMNGRELSRAIQLSCPDIKVLFMSGYTASVIEHHGVLKEGINFIQKPFTKKELAEKMREVFEN